MEKRNSYNRFARYPRTTIFILLLLVPAISVFTIEKYLALLKGSAQIWRLTTRYIVLREYQPLPSFTFIPDSAFIKKSAPGYIENKEVRIRIDKDGFIEPSKLHEKPDVTIVFLGGSTTELQNVQENNRFPYLAGRILEKRLKKKVNSYNGAIMGNHSVHSVNTLINKVLPLKPDIVVMEHNFNDLVQLLYMEEGYWCKGPRTLIADERAVRSAAIRSIIYKTMPNLYFAI